jgi:hypothetical protein
MHPGQIVCSSCTLLLLLPVIVAAMPVMMSILPASSASTA